MRFFMTRRHIAISIAACAAVLALSGCSADGQITDETVLSKKYHLGQQSGLAVSSQNVDVNGYKVSSSVGYMSGMEQKSANGYTVFSSVQGNIAAETFTEIRQ
jgi:protein involved in sex pheromone biosynthesis